MEVFQIPLPKGANTNDPELIVIHAMGQYIHVNKDTYDHYKGKGVTLELNRDYHASEWLRVIGLSAHRLMEPSGDLIICRQDNQGAYHAKGFNTNSLGIEFLIPGTWTYDPMIQAMKKTWMTDIQLANGAYVIKSWMKKHSISIENVKTHIGIDPNRKKDPGVEAGRLFEELKQLT